MSKKETQTETAAPMDGDDNVVEPISPDDGQVEQTPQDALSEPVSDFINNPDVLAYIEKAIQDGIQKALKGTPPKANTANTTEQEQKNFDRMTYKERLNLFKTNPQTYYKLTKGEK
jgi:hypothetical protein